MKKILLFAFLCALTGSLYPAATVVDIDEKVPLVDDATRAALVAAVRVPIVLDVIAKEALQESIQCTICLQECSAENPNVVVRPCDPGASPALHHICRDCMKTYEEKKKAAGSVDIPCPICKKPLNITQVDRKTRLFNSIMGGLGSLNRAQIAVRAGIRRNPGWLYGAAVGALFVAADALELPGKYTSLNRPALVIPSGAVIGALMHRLFCTD